MNATLAFVLGLAAGGVVAALLITPTDCCARVAAGVRAEVKDKLGGTAVAVGDALGIWGYTPGLLTALGVKP